MPLSYLLLLFIGVPVIELVLLLEVHNLVGLLPTVLLIFSTGVIGATLVKKQGLSILLSIQRELSLGNLPAPQLMDGVMILMAGAFLITPGILTDAVGFLLLVPFMRSWIRGFLRKKLEKKLRDGSMQIRFY